MAPKFWPVAGPWILILTLAGCATSPEPGVTTETLVENLASPTLGLQLELTSAPGRSTRFRLSCPDLGPVTVHGTAVASPQGEVLEFESLDWFSSWPGGWTEVSFLLEGELLITRDAPSDVVVADLQTFPRLDAVRSATIRFFDSYVRGAEGEKEFSLRWKRIQAVCRELAARFNGPSLARQPELLKRFLFPEVFDPSALLPVSATSFQDGQRWNPAYSRQVLSPGLRKLRDSGSLFRDFQESPGLWQLALVWDDFWQHHGHSAALRQGQPPH